MGYAPGDIIRYAEFALQSASDEYRIKVLNTVVSIVRSTYESNKDT